MSRQSYKKHAFIFMFQIKMSFIKQSYQKNNAEKFGNALSNHNSM
jgi:hypothetical protein